MKPSIRKLDRNKEIYTREHCYIIESSNTDDDPDVSIAQARVEPGVTTRWHRLSGITERYCILSGSGLVETGELPAEEVSAGDVVIIPPMCPQRISNTGSDDLVFLAICSPRFSEDCYEDIEQVQTRGTVSDETASSPATENDSPGAKMIVDIYSTNVEDIYISVPEGTVISSIEIIDEADRGIEEVQLSKAGLVLDPAEPRMGLNQTDIISQIMTRGYAIHTTRLDTNIDLSGSKLA